MKTLTQIALHQTAAKCIAVSALALALISGCRPSGSIQRAAEKGYNFAGLSAYTISGGDTEGASLTGFENDTFHNLFVRAARLVLNERGLREVNPNDPDAPQKADMVMRYTLRKTLLITVMDADARRLIWRGESQREFTTESMNPDSINELVRDILSGFPG